MMDITKSSGRTEKDCPIVETKLGKVRGHTLAKPKGESAKPVLVYSGIPFAKPPVGQLRFESPEKPDRWDGVLDATKFPASPCQDGKFTKNVNEHMVFVKVSTESFTEFSEDCLYLTVYTSNADTKANMPVLFWIYGGGFCMGGSSFYNGQVLAGLHDVVVVTPNYRVNAFGFFELGQDTEYKGNMGLLDQVMALEWTRDNIRNFGGNPDNVTIFGESAGSISVGLHLLSPLSKGLFHRAIGHSGAANYPPLIRTDQSRARKSFFEKLNITEAEPAAEIMRKLKSASAEEIVKAQDIENYIYFCVSVGDEFLPQTPRELYEKGDFAPVPLIFGCNSSEGHGLLAVDFPAGFAEGYDEAYAVEMIKGMFDLSVPPDKLDKAVEMVKEKFKDVYAADDKQRWSKILGDLMAELWFVAPMIEQADEHSAKGHKTFMYSMTQQLRCNHDKAYGSYMKPDFCECDHTDDIVFTFGMPFAEGEILPKVRFTDSERELCRKWMQYIVNFATTGDPNKGVKVDYEWPVYDGLKRHLLAREHFATGKDLLANRYEFWMKSIAEL